MRTIEIVPYKTYRNVNTGERISIFSCIPYGRREDWEIVTSGYTWQLISARGDLTQGMGRVPAKTYEDAEKIAKRYAEVTGATFLK